MTLFILLEAALITSRSVCNLLNTSLCHTLLDLIRPRLKNLQLITGISSNKTGTIRLTTPASQYKNTPKQYQK